MSSAMMWTAKLPKEYDASPIKRDRKRIADLEAENAVLRDRIKRLNWALGLLNDAMEDKGDD